MGNAAPAVAGNGASTTTISKEEYIPRTCQRQPRHEWERERQARLEWERDWAARHYHARCAAGEYSGRR